VSLHMHIRFRHKKTAKLNNRKKTQRRGLRRRVGLQLVEDDSGQKPDTENGRVWNCFSGPPVFFLHTDVSGKPN